MTIASLTVRNIFIVLTYIYLTACSDIYSVANDMSDLKQLHNDCLFGRFGEKEIRDRINEIIQNKGNDELFSIFVIAECSRYIEEYEQSIIYYTYLIERDEASNDVIYELRGDVFLLNSNKNNALKDYTKSIENNNRNYSVYEKRAEIYRDNSDYSHAINDYLSALEILISRRKCEEDCHGYALNEVRLYSNLLELYKKLDMDERYNITRDEATTRNPGATEVFK